MPNKKFKPGDVVRLISDDRPMTVTGDNDTNPDTAWCIWRNADGTSNGSAFPESALVKVDSPGKPTTANPCV